MEREILIKAEGLEITAVLDNSETADRIWEALPIESSASTWGDEIYFTVPVQIDEAGDARQDMEVGELGYWPTGSAFCIFFGRTPASTSEQPRAASNVNPFGFITGDLEDLFSVHSGDKISVIRVE